MNELAVIPQEDIDTALAKVEGLQTLFASETNHENAQAKKDASLELSKIAKLLDSKRQDAVKPALEEQKRINGVFKPTIDKIEDLSKKLISQVQTFVRIEEQKERERKAEIARIEAEKLIAGKLVEPVTEIAPSPVIPKVSETKVWVYEVVDLDKVPRDYLTIYDYEVQKAIKAGTRSILGLKIFQETRVGRR